MMPMRRMMVAAMAAHMGGAAQTKPAPSQAPKKKEDEASAREKLLASGATFIRRPLR